MVRYPNLGFRKHGYLYISALKGRCTVKGWRNRRGPEAGTSVPSSSAIARSGQVVYHKPNGFRDGGPERLKSSKSQTMRGQS